MHSKHDMDMDMDMEHVRSRPYSQLNGLTHKPSRSRCPPPHLLTEREMTSRPQPFACFQNYYTLSQHSVTALNRSFFPLKSAEKKAQSRKIFFAGRCPAPRRATALDLCKPVISLWYMALQHFFGG